MIYKILILIAILLLLTIGHNERITPEEIDRLYPDTLPDTNIPYRNDQQKYNL